MKVVVLCYGHHKMSDIRYLVRAFIREQVAHVGLSTYLAYLTHLMSSISGMNNLDIYRSPIAPL